MMKFNFSREWLKWAAETEDGCSVGVGVDAINSSTESGDNCNSVSRNTEDSSEAVSSQQGRIRFYIQLLISDWGKTVTRAALDGCLILMLDDELRVALLGGTPVEGDRPSNRTIHGLDYILQELQMGRKILMDNEYDQQRISLISPFQDVVSKLDRKRLKELKQYFENQRRLGRVDETEECLDARIDLIST